MAYGERLHAKPPGDYGVIDYFKFAFAGSVGIAAATLTDLNQRGEASALYQISIALTRIIGAEYMPFYVVLLVLMVLGAASIFFMQPLSMREAFLQGFGLLAVMMTILPANYVNAAPPQMEMTEDGPVEVASGQARVTAPVLLNAALPAARPAAMQDDRDMMAYNLVIRIEFPNGLQNEMSTMLRRGTLRGRLYNESTKTSYDLFSNGGADATMSGNTLTIRTSIPGTAPTTTMYARVEATGYQIILESYTAQRGNNSTWSISMTPSNTPLFLQRLTNTYWF